MRLLGSPDPRHVAAYLDHEAEPAELTFVSLTPVHLGRSTPVRARV